MVKASVLLVEIGFQELLYKGWLRWQKQIAGKLFSAEAGSSEQKQVVQCRLLYEVQFA